MNPFNLPPLSMPLSRLAGAVLLSLASAACSGPTDTSSPAAAAPAATPAPLLQQLHAQIGDAACDNSAQCRTLAVGSKACGGPEQYLPWSTKRTDGVTLGKLAEEYAAARNIENAKSDLMSTCDLITDPGATCQQQRCMLLPRGPGPGGPPVL